MINFNDVHFIWQRIVILPHNVGYIEAARDVSHLDSRVEYC